MITIKTDDDGNLKLKDGRFVLIDGADSMLQEARHRSFLFRGDDMFNTERGISPVDTLRGSLQSPDILSSQMESQIEDSDEVYEATVDIKKEKDTYNFKISLVSIYGRFGYNV